jgi:hypothetical protein
MECTESRRMFHTDECPLCLFRSHVRCESARPFLGNVRVREANPLHLHLVRSRSVCHRNQVRAGNSCKWLYQPRMMRISQQGKLKYSKRTCLHATLSATNPIWLDLGLNPARRHGKPVTNGLSYEWRPWNMILMGTGFKVQLSCRNYQRIFLAKCNLLPVLPTEASFSRCWYYTWWSLPTLGDTTRLLMKCVTPDLGSVTLVPCPY